MKVNQSKKGKGMSENFLQVHILQSQNCVDPGPAIIKQVAKDLMAFEMSYRKQKGEKI